MRSSFFQSLVCRFNFQRQFGSGAGLTLPLAIAADDSLCRIVLTPAVRSRLRSSTYPACIHHFIPRAQSVRADTNQFGVLCLECMGYVLLFQQASLDCHGDTNKSDQKGPRICTILEHVDHWDARGVADHVASMNFFNGTQLPSSRTFLAVYPICLFFFVFAWMIMIQ